MTDALFEMPEPTPAKTSAYRVLARKYRPQNFSELKGQDVLVRTLTNAFESGRIAHAFMLTGIRGVGKTTTARIIAKGLNCESGPTINPCGKCPACVSIAEGRNIDVIEMNAADNRKIDDVRKIIESAKYAPTSCRTKIYILDEVHMFVDEAFNALLKILEEPPPHVKFILATTEIRKVPVTILSRCQRFDLRRLEPDVLMAHFAEVGTSEGITIDTEASQLLARAADGSARDGLSLLDQAIARGGTHVTADVMRDMLGLADRSHILDLLVSTLTGKPAEALAQLAVLHRDGADPLTVLQDLLDATHQLSRLKVLPEGSRDLTATDSENERLQAIAGQFSVPVLARAWQVLLKGVPEVQQSSRPMAALEMLLIRLAHMGDLPTPGDLLKKLEGVNITAALGAAGAGATPSNAPTAGSSGGAAMLRAAVGMSHAAAQPAVAAQAAVQIADWRSAVALFGERREMQLYGQLYTAVECLRFAPGQIDLYTRPGVPPALVQRVTTCLQDWTGNRWLINVSRKSGGLTLAEEDDAKQLNVLREAAEHPLVKAVLLAFPGAKIEAVRDKVVAAPDDDSTPNDMTPDEE